MSATIQMWLTGITEYETIKLETDHRTHIMRWQSDVKHKKSMNQSGDRQKNNAWVYQNMKVTSRQLIITKILLQVTADHNSSCEITQQLHLTFTTQHSVTLYVKKSQSMSDPIWRV